MSTITFDTLELVDKLKTAGIPQEQAEAVVKVIVEAQHELSTRRDIDDLRRDMDSRLIQLEQRLVIKLGGLIALSIGLVAALVKLL
jgi:alpha-galactosidase